MFPEITALTASIYYYFILLCAFSTGNILGVYYAFNVLAFLRDHAVPFIFEKVKNSCVVMYKQGKEWCMYVYERGKKWYMYMYEKGNSLYTSINKLYVEKVQPITKPIGKAIHDKILFFESQKNLNGLKKKKL